jgi:hypothetical protein
MGNVANVIVGSAQLFIADAGTPVPTLTGNASDFAAFTDPGFTDDGVEMDYTPSMKKIMVDELSSPVKQVITAEDLVIAVKLAETTLQNLFYALAGGVLVSATEITLGGLTIPNEFVLGFIGPSPSTPNAVREGVIYRVIQKQAVKAHYQRKDKQIYQCQFEAMADSSFPLGANLCDIQDF